MSPVMRKPASCICENKDADQLRSNCAADQRLCFRYTGSKIPILPKSEISSIWLSFVAVQPGLCRTWSETRRPVFSQRGSNIWCTKRVKSGGIGAPLFFTGAPVKFSDGPLNITGAPLYFTGTRYIYRWTAKFTGIIAQGKQIFKAHFH